MSLDTVLKIGRLLRNSSRRLDFFSYVASPKDKEGNYPLYLNIPVGENYDIDFDNISIA